MMRILIFLFFYPLFTLASLIPYKVEATITSVSNNKVTLNRALPLTHMSALVVRDIDNTQYAIAYIKQSSNKEATVIDKDPIGGEHLATIKPTVSIGDRVKAGFLYDKYLLLAPNKHAYEQIKNNFALNPIDSELFLAYLKAKHTTTPSSNDYKEFAKLLGVGLFIIAKDNTLELYDPISKAVIKKVPFNFDNSIKIKPFYTNLAQ